MLDKTVSLKFRTLKHVQKGLAKSVLYDEIGGLKKATMGKFDEWIRDGLLLQTSKGNAKIITATEKGIAEYEQIEKTLKGE